MSSTADKEIVLAPEYASEPEPVKDVDEDLRARVFSKPSPKATSTEPPYHHDG